MNNPVLALGQPRRSQEEEMKMLNRACSKDVQESMERELFLQTNMNRRKYRET
jgi:hypothetical protein